MLTAVLRPSNLLHFFHTTYIVGSICRVVMRGYVKSSLSAAAWKWCFLSSLLVAKNFTFGQNQSVLWNKLLRGEDSRRLFCGYVGYISFVSIMKQSREPRVRLWRSSVTTVRRFTEILFKQCSSSTEPN